MNRIILLFLILWSKTNTFIENVIEQEYSLICQDKNIHCDCIHILYNECGQLLFNIWLSLDLLLSVNVNFNDYDELYLHLENKIKIIHDKITKINNHNSKTHLLDNKKLLFYINKITSHQIIKYNDILLINITDCKKKIMQILIQSLV